MELVYMVPFIGVEHHRRVPVYKYQQLNGKVNINKRTKDKNAYENCYDDLVPGKNYVVVTEKKENKGRVGRWVFVEAYELPAAEVGEALCTRLRQIDTESTVPGYITTPDKFKQAAVEVIKLWKIKQHLESAKRLLEGLLT